jgi:hypothetical protein
MAPLHVSLGELPVHRASRAFVAEPVRPSSPDTSNTPLDRGHQDHVVNAIETTRSQEGLSPKFAGAVGGPPRPRFIDLTQREHGMLALKAEGNTLAGLGAAIRDTMSRGRPGKARPESALIAFLVSWIPAQLSQASLTTRKTPEIHFRVQQVQCCGVTNRHKAEANNACSPLPIQWRAVDPGVWFEERLWDRVATWVLWRGVELL